MKLQEIREARAAKAKEADALLAKDAKAYTAEDSSKVDELLAEISALDAREAQLKKVTDLNASLETPEEKARRIAAAGDQRSVDELTHNATNEKAVMAAWLRGGISNLTEEQLAVYRALPRDEQSAGDPTKGGYLAPGETATDLLTKLKEFGGMREVSTPLPTGHGRDIDWPTSDDTSEMGEIVGENKSATTGDVLFGTVGIGAYKYSSKVFAVPVELLQDSVIDIVAYINQVAATRIGRRQNLDFTTGDGTNKPLGLVPSAALGVTMANGNTVTLSYDAFVDLEHSVNPAYRKSPGCRWMFHDTVLKTIKKLKDSQGRPLWRPGMSGPDSDNILNYKFTINQDMAEPAASAKTVLFGDMKKYLIRDVRGVTLFRFEDSAYMQKGQVGFMAWARADGAFIDASNESVRYLAQSAS